MASPIGLIAGSGELPIQMVSHCRESSTPLYVVALEGITEMNATSGVEHIWSPLAKVGYIIKNLKGAGVEKLVFAGAIQRPNFSKLSPDMKGMKLLTRLTTEIGQGDNALLTTIIRFMEKEGFEVIGIENVMDGLVAEEGVLTKGKVDKQTTKDIALGTQILKSLSPFDIGQAVIVDHGQVLGIEGPEGTKQLIARVANLRKRDGQSGALIKMAKTSQDRRIDLPSIGTETVNQLHHAGIKTVAVDAGSSLILNKTETISLANELGITIVGVK